MGTRGARGRPHPHPRPHPRPHATGGSCRAWGRGRVRGSAAQRGERGAGAGGNLCSELTPGLRAAVPSRRGREASAHRPSRPRHTQPHDSPTIRKTPIQPRCYCRAFVPSLLLCWPKALLLRTAALGARRFGNSLLMTPPKKEPVPPKS